VSTVGPIKSRKTKRTGWTPSSRMIETIVPPSVEYVVTRAGNMITVRVEHTYPDVDPTFFHWYVDGVYMGQTTRPERSFYLPDGSQAYVETVITYDADFDAYANAPPGYPARMLITWHRSPDTDVAWYKVEQLKSGGSWTEIGRVRHKAGKWFYRLLSPRLDQTGVYSWRVTPIDAAGNEGTVETIDDVPTFYRRADAPDWTFTFDDGTAKITISEA